MNLSTLCDDDFRRLVRERLESFAVREIDAAHHRPAAVALTIVEEGSGADLDGVPAPDGWGLHASILLTRRDAALKNHPGQWALPGGRIDDGETAEEAALRELREEVDLALEPDCILGRLDAFATRSGYAITPVVVWGGRAKTLHPNAGEVASIHRIPVREFLRADAPLLDPGDVPDRPVLRMPVGKSWIAAPTAAIIYQFREVCVLGRATRVAHFEQPAFAWR